MYSRPLSLHRLKFERQFWGAKFGRVNNHRGDGVGSKKAGKIISFSHLLYPAPPPPRFPPTHTQACLQTSLFMLSKTASQKPWRINSELKRTVNIIPLLTQLTIQNIFPYHTDVVVTVRSTLLVPEPNCVTQLVFHHVLKITVVADRDLGFGVMVSNMTPATKIKYNHRTRQS